METLIYNIDELNFIDLSKNDPNNHANKRGKEIFDSIKGILPDKKWIKSTNYMKDREWNDTKYYKTRFYQGPDYFSYIHRTYERIITYDRSILPGVSLIALEVLITSPDKLLIEKFRQSIDDIIKKHDSTDRVYNIKSRCAFISS